jgi:hypothetical protein
MADTQVSDLTGISSAADNDLLYIVDVSDTTDDAGGSSRKITRQQFLGITGDAVGTDDTQTLTNKTLTSPAVTGLTGTLSSPVITTPQINDTSSDHQYVFAVSELAADRTVTLPLLTGNDTFVFADFTQTLTNKTLTSPTLTTPTLGVATATSINKVTITAPATSATLTLVTGSSLITSGAYAITLTSTATTGVTLPTTGTLATLAGTETFTNKRITKRITTITSSATPTVNTDNCDCVTITALAAAITSMSTNLSGTPTNFQTLIYRIKDDGTARGITWGTSFEAKGVDLPTTTVLSKVLTVGFIYDSVSGKFGCVASVQEA